jgi:ketosteroid isomerase-like protein
MRTLCLATVVLASCASAPQRTPLSDEIAAMDKAMFEAFNAHDLDRLMPFFSDDLEFFHDTGGLLTKADAMEGFWSNFARNNGLRRDLVPGSLEVVEIKGYGAVEIGAHRFCHLENNKQDCGTFKFLHVWRKTDAGWKVTRVISYGH